MSCYEWESGAIVLPTAAVPGLRKALNAAAAEYRELVCEQVAAVWDGVKALPPGKRADAIPNCVEVPFTGTAAKQRAHALMDAQCLVKYLGGRKPTRAQIEKVRPAPTARTRTWRESEFQLDLDGRTLQWEVSENNHARDEAEETILQRAALRYLATVTWTRGSGGDLIGNDEYNCCDRSAGGGGNYVTRSFGPGKPVHRY